MVNCKKCGNEFEPQKGLHNYCSISCRNSRTFTPETNQKKRLSVLKVVPYIGDAKCDYCEGESKYILKNGKHCCEDSFNKCPSIKQKNTDGLKKAYVEGRKNKNVFTPEHRAKSNEKNIERAKVESFGSHVLRLSSEAKSYIRDERNNTCDCCGITEWNGKPIILEVHHIDGDNSNNVKENLQVLCPNCHSQTDTWRGRNVNNSKKKVSDAQIVETYTQEGNIHRTLIKLGLAPKGGNYYTIKQILVKYNISST